MIRRLLLLLLLGLLFQVSPGYSQGTATGSPVGAGCMESRHVEVGLPGDAYSDFVRLSALAGLAPVQSFLVRRGLDREKVVVCVGGLTEVWTSTPPSTRLPGGLTFESIPLRSSAHYNSAYPRDRNNGALWSGRGLSTELSGGLSVRWGPVSAAFAPKLIYQENRDFGIVDTDVRSGLSPYIYRGKIGTIDWPQRFGDRSYNVVDAGQSFIRLDLSALAVGVSTENLWWGPARRNPLMMSSTAPGFPHLFLGSSRPIDLWLFRAEGELIWGRLQESRYFDDEPENDRQLLAGIAFTLEPRWFPGLYLGASRSFMKQLPSSGLPPTKEWLIAPYRDIRDNPLDRAEGDNQLFSIFMRWAPPHSGFEAYFEFLRDDHWEDTKDLAAEPEVSGAYTVGLQQVLTRGDRWWRVSAELTQIADPLPIMRRGPFTIYAHGQLRQGYTNKGRLLGAPIGPNGNAQYLGLDRFTSSEARGIYLERVRTNIDEERQRWTRAYGGAGADIEWNIGLHQRRFFPRLDLGWSLTHSLRQNRHYLGLHSDEPYFLRERNWNLKLDLAWRPGR